MKKLLSVVLAVVMVATMGATAFADVKAPGGGVSVVNLSKAISPQTIAKITENVSATFVRDDGTVVPLDSVVTIEDAPLSRQRMLRNPDAKAYRVSVAAAVAEEFTSGDFTEGGVDAYAELIMEWIDILGTKNQIEYVGGSRTVYSGTVREATARYGEYGNAENQILRYVTNMSAFGYMPQTVAWSLFANYNITFSGVGTLYLTVRN